MEIAILAFATLISSYASGEDQKSLQPDLQHLYKRKLLSLRNPSFGKTLSFNSSGAPLDHAIAGPWSTCGLLQEEKIKVEQDGVDIDGKRVILALRSEGLKTQVTASLKLEVVPLVTSEGVHIRMQMSPVSAKQINETLTEVFEGGQLLDRVAAYWKPKTNDVKAFGMSTPNAGVGELEGSRPVYLVNPGVIEPPKAIHTPDPEYTEAARSERLQGTTVLSIVVNEQGFPEMLEIVRGLGQGLDIQALLAVASWRFKPATKDGKPVAVLINVEVRFSLG